MTCRLMGRNGRYRSDVLPEARRGNGDKHHSTIPTHGHCKLLSAHGHHLHIHTCKATSPAFPTYDVRDILHVNISLQYRHTATVNYFLLTGTIYTSTRIAMAGATLQDLLPEQQPLTQVPWFLV
ncbi:hypothetical protein J6590_011200 [Homalodisca vitripennis]|nr:hypothetical protein J6590_011200 [Homalodisca vitripennis]